MISTHTPLAGRDFFLHNLFRYFMQFLLTRPSRGATMRYEDFIRYAEISTHTPLAGRDQLLEIGAVFHGISTHTPLAGRDRYILSVIAKRFPYIEERTFSS